MKNELHKLNYAIWMLSNAIQHLTDAIQTHEHDTKATIAWITEAVDSMAEAEKAIEDTKILPW